MRKVRKLLHIIVFYVFKNAPFLIYKICLESKNMIYRRDGEVRMVSNKRQKRGIPGGLAIRRLFFTLLRPFFSRNFIISYILFHCRKNTFLFLISKVMHMDDWKSVISKIYAFQFLHRKTDALGYQNSLHFISQRELML